MFITSLALSQFRNFATAKISPSTHINLLVGANGSGKTSLLEAIYTLGFGRSFRPGSYQQLIRHEQDAFVVFAKLGRQGEDKTYQVGYQRNGHGDVQLRINQENEKRFAALARLVPVQLMTPESIDLILGGPKVRRQFLDWGVFHVEHSFYQDWVNFSKVLKQRNSLLKSRRFDAERGYWDKVFSEHGERIQTHRAKYVEGLAPYLESRLEAFLPQYEFTVQLRQGWDKNQTLQEALDHHKDQDVRYGHTTVGPHKAELKVQANGDDVKNLLSRGQLKLLVAALKLVQGEYLFERTGIQCIYLVDDLTAELDDESQEKFCDALIASNSQVFVSAIEVGRFVERLQQADTKMFHVEHGTIKEQ